MKFGYWYYYLKYANDAAFLCLSEDQLVMVCADMLIAGAQTTSNTLDFAVLMMILHENIQNKVQEELDKVCESVVPIEYSHRIR